MEYGYEQEGMSVIGMVIMAIFYLGIIGLMIASSWKIYEKAGKPGWAAIVPIYNIIVLFDIIKKPVWWIILLFIPFVNIVILFIMYIALAKAFGKGTGYGIGLIFLGIVFYPMLAFSDAQYEGNALDSRVDSFGK